MADEKRSVPREILRGIEPLWSGALAALFTIGGYALIPIAIRAIGRSGQTETVEWGVYMSLLVGYPLVCTVVALLFPKLLGERATAAIRVSIITVAIVLGIVFVAQGRFVHAAFALVPAVITALLSFGAYKVLSERPVHGIVALCVLGFVALVAWMSAGGLVYWTRAATWFLGSPMRFVAIAVATVVAIGGLPPMGDTRETKAAPGVAYRIVSVFMLLILIVFSFRTNPVVESYHWEFWTGPIDQVRQGGRLLMETPAQYGFLSILLPAILPGRSQISFWYYQAAIYSVVAVLMFVIFRRLRGGVGNLLLSFLVVFTTLFFRPRSEALILPAQMTPSGGPIRFLWCFVMLGWLLLVYRDYAGHKNRSVHNLGAGFPIVGHIIWTCSIAWSVEAGVYSGAIWLPAFTVYLIQKRKGILRELATPIVLLLALYAIVWLLYKLVYGIAPDLMNYAEFGLFYTSNFASLPIVPSGAVWYLILIFMIASTAVVQFLVEDWKDFRLAVAAAVWGGTWALASYFTARSHPVNLLSITPPLLFGMAVLLIVIRHSERREWHRYLRAAMVPVLAIPIAMTLGHPGLRANLATPQLAPSQFENQVTSMDPSLEMLLKRVGAKPTDAFVQVGDGRLTLDPWSPVHGVKRRSERSWLPKPYEIIGQLPAERRDVYLARSARQGIGGWLIHHATDTIAKFDERFREFEKYWVITDRETEGPWIVWRVQPRVNFTRP